MIGFELLFSTIRSELRSKNDLLIAVIHLQSIQRGFLCVGTGEEFPETPENGSELLPNGWNQSDETYILRYINPKTNQKLLIKGVKVSELLLISALIIGNNYASSHQINTNDHISNDFNSFDRAFVSGSVDNVSQIIEKEVINKTLGRPPEAPNANTNTNERNERNPETGNDPLRVGPPRYPHPIGAGFDPIQGGQWPPPIGGADLDPLGNAQGGMIMDPRIFPQPFGRPRNPAPGLPRGAVPPGARFDPFGPGIGPNPRPNRNPRHMAPDPDHLPPPGYDDMFM